MAATKVSKDGTILKIEITGESIPITWNYDWCQPTFSATHVEIRNHGNGMAGVAVNIALADVRDGAGAAIGSNTLAEVLTYWANL